MRILRPECRPETNDHLVCKAVIDENEYQLPDDMSGWTVVDVGAHIGAFTYSAMVRGAERVYAFEPCRSTYATLLLNTAAMNNVFPAHAAVWRNDKKPTLNWMPLKLDVGINPADPQGMNLGGSSIVFNKGPLEGFVMTIPLDAILDAIIYMVDLLKIDAEGAEFPILLTSKKLDRVNRIVGECHEGESFLPQTEIAEIAKAPDPDLLTDALCRAGFKVRWERNAPYRLFFATRE